MLRKYFFPAFIFSLFAAPTVFAHEKWFINSATVPLGKPLLFSQWSSVNASAALLGIFALLAALLIHFAVRPHRWARSMRSFFGKWAAWVPSVLRTLTGLLLFSASFSRFLFAPDLQTAVLPLPVERVLLAVQLLVGLAFIVGIFPRFMSLLGLTLYIVALGVFPWFDVLSYLFFVGIFAFIFIVGDPSLPKVRSMKIFPNLENFSHLKEAKPYAMSLLRMFAGIAIMFVAARFKLYEPGYALEFLRTHNVNFMPALGFVNFSNELFVLAAGIIELLLGFLIFLGLLPRLSGAVLIICFTLTLGLFGIYELLGHLPLFAVAFAMIIKGGGERWSCELSAALPKRAAKR
ncbi:DoxX family membrane protein [Candidatus Peregrinibacteria bacterium]|nr:DoxX family membrane protein [Candidatus Peregrinibacteria bacterium]